MGGVIFDEGAEEPRFIFSGGNEPTTTTPGAADEQATLRFLPNQGDPCTNTTYGEICEEDEFDGNYPEDLVKSLIKTSNTLKSPVHFNKLFERPCDYEPIVTQFRVSRWSQKSISCVVVFNHRQLYQVTRELPGDALV